MSKQKIINVTIGLNGEVELAPTGYGKHCKDATKFLETALGLDTSKRKDTPELLQQETVAQKQTT